VKGVINSTAVLSVSSPFASHTQPASYMARLYTLRPIQTDFDLGYDHQQVTRSAQGLPLRAGYAASSRTPADTHHVEHEDRSLERTWNQVRLGNNPNNEIDLRARQSFSFSRTGNGGKSVDNRAVSHLHAYPRVVTPPHLI